MPQLAAAAVIAAPGAGLGLDIDAVPRRGGRGAARRRRAGGAGGGP
ncbi:MAG: hypothetical protein HS111_02915 [Kofleriaceae bacterium]|nr:hypothetical protein [Kofleriaceae bacterium]